MISLYIIRAMCKTILTALLTILIIAPQQNSYAHGAGGGSQSYKYDTSDKIADREAEHKAAEEQQTQESWSDFMDALKKTPTKKKSEIKTNDNFSDKN